ncbi:hypothetical protein AXG55_14420 (plasmid) [Silvanigrella aquatica]|uniref:Uncharacterized protein n=1 Tax=Silvanigrella aquatica TaxID=1915309 RepID=A0A1L4D4T4_9BACT|nr:hypothetical protein AXG55_14420 [Silvanigrella aquatica]
MNSKIIKFNRLACYFLEDFISPILEIMEIFFYMLIFIFSFTLSLIYIIQKFKISEVILIDFSKYFYSFNYNFGVFICFFCFMFYFKLIKNTVFNNINKYKILDSSISVAASSEKLRLQK